MRGSWLHEGASRGGVGEGISSWVLQGRAGGKISGVVEGCSCLESNSTGKVTNLGVCNWKVTKTTENNRKVRK